MKKPLIGITGSTGFVGTNLINFLVSKDYPIKALVYEDDHYLPNKVEVVKGDLLKTNTLGDFTKDVNIFIHLAARILPPEEKMEKDNVEATKNLIKKVNKNTTKKIIYLSTAAVYGGGKRGFYKERDKCKPLNVYAKTKCKAEKIIEKWGKKTGNKYIILRPFNVYGPGNKKGVVYDFYKSIKENGNLTLRGSGLQKRDFLYIDDLVGAIYRAILTEKKGVYNLPSGNYISIKQLINFFKKVVKKHFDVVKNTEVKNGKDLPINISTKKTKKGLKWEASTSLLTGLTKTIDWYDRN